MRVTGFGGLFFKSADPERLYQWYEKHLGIQRNEYGVSFQWAEDPAAAEGFTAWAIFPATSTYFDPGRAPFMMNLRVERAEGIARQAASRRCLGRRKVRRARVRIFRLDHGSGRQSHRTLGTACEEIGVSDVPLQSRHCA
jgi:hypothetical protein